MVKYRFDAVIVGAGHAGVEAALACARLGLKTAVITINTDQVAAISCNPSVGGLGKSHIVREIDALGGEMARLADMSALQYKMLNRSKGMAVWSLRCQIDKHLYSRYAAEALKSEPNISLFQDNAAVLTVKDKKVTGIVTEREVHFLSPNVILCTGTFLKGRIYIGDYRTKGGRIGELSSEKLSVSLKKLGFRLGRLKTGTPSRVASGSIDYSRLEREDGDRDEIHFCWEDGLNQNPRLPCYITYTNKKTHTLIRRNKSRSPLYSGVIKGIGPRYCPSIEDKVFRFADRDRHQLYLEPEGLGYDETYINGLSSSLPEDVQHRFIRTIKGMENVKIIKPAYAIEYDFIDPTHLKHSLESRLLEGLFTAGQLNGTSGYEEAAGQGLIAGINAAMRYLGREPFILDRSEAYIGVMIDDLVLKGTREPYRMFTSRAENRLALRFDNADLRLSSRGREAGLLSKKQWRYFCSRKKEVERLKKNFHEDRLTTTEIKKHFGISCVPSPVSYLIRRTDIDNAMMMKYLVSNYKSHPTDIAATAADIRYEGYILKQAKEQKKMKERIRTLIPPRFNYKMIRGLKKEALQKLQETRPENIEYASRIPGLTPADIQLLLFHLHKKSIR